MQLLYSQISIISDMHQRLQGGDYTAKEAPDIRPLSVACGPLELSRIAEL